QGLAENGVGLWPEESPAMGIRGAVRDAESLRPVRAALREIGYQAAAEGALDPALSLVLRAFQRHWRPEAVTGQADDGTLVRLLDVQKLIRSG
ncbi:MAG TPA: peptidoglycan-binding protein, partial [Bryobacteraceae bacterium]|nr:peptidoglycan-binding protein [Bryobacteraceae bacterium]